MSSWETGLPDPEEVNCHKTKPSGPRRRPEGFALVHASHLCGRGGDVTGRVTKERAVPGRPFTGYREGRDMPNGPHHRPVVRTVRQPESLPAGGTGRPCLFKAVPCAPSPHAPEPRAHTSDFPKAGKGRSPSRARRPGFSGRGSYRPRPSGPKQPDPVIIPTALSCASMSTAAASAGIRDRASVLSFRFGSGSRVLLAGQIWACSNSVCSQVLVGDPVPKSGPVKSVQVLRQGSSPPEPR